MGKFARASPKEDTREEEMSISNKQKTLKITQISILVALVVVLQLLSAVLTKIIPFLPFSITLTLVPVVIGAILFGEKGGAILGFFFGGIVLVNCATGLDIGGLQLWSANPFLTALICFVKGIAAGVVPALVYRLLTKNNNKKLLAVILAAISAPIVNTSLFVCGALIFFMDILKAWSGETNLLLYIIVGLAGFNFLFEFVVNLVLSPAILRIIGIIGKDKHIKI